MQIPHVKKKGGTYIFTYCHVIRMSHTNRYMCLLFQVKHDLKIKKKKNSEGGDVIMQLKINMKTI